MKLSREQAAAAARVERMLSAGRREVTVGGLAGTGKTQIASGLPELLGLPRRQVAYCTYTGKAAHVLNQRIRAAGGEPTASTIHRLIYRPAEHHCGLCPRGEWEPSTSDPADAGPPCHARKAADCGGCFMTFERVFALGSELRLIVCDEASMVDADIYRDLLSYGVPVVWIGDHAQLPPVTGSFSVIAEPDIRLEKIHRQVAGSPVLKLATIARTRGKLPPGEYGPGVIVRRATGELEWDPAVMMLCGRNATRVRINKAVRRTRGYPADRPRRGDRVICLRNNYEAGIYNGMTGTVLRRGPLEDGAYRVAIRLDYGGGTYRGYVAAEQFNEQGRLDGLPRGSVDLWDYGYCITVHKAQGSEAERVILFNEPVGRTADARRRWLYTGITRAKTGLEVLCTR